MNDAGELPKIHRTLTIGRPFGVGLRLVNPEGSDR
jgi:hypothetical protein